MLVKIIEDKKYFNSYRTMYPYLRQLEEIGIRFTNQDGVEGDAQLICHYLFASPKLSYWESVTQGVKYVDSFKNPILWDASDSTSLFATLDVFESSKAKFMLKNQILKDSNQYSIKSPYNKVFWNKYADIWNKEDPGIMRFIGAGYEDLDYTKWENILLSGCNVLNWIYPSDLRTNYKSKSIDFCLMIGPEKKTNLSFGYDNSFAYNMHRKTWIHWANEMKALGYKVFIGQKPYKEYIQTLQDSKVCISPFGMGEICLRDVEACMCNCHILKPSSYPIKTAHVPASSSNYFSETKDMLDNEPYTYENYFREVNNNTTILSTWQKIKASQ